MTKNTWHAFNKCSQCYTFQTKGTESKSRERTWKAEVRSSTATISTSHYCRMTGDDHNSAGSHYISFIYIHLLSQPEQREAWTKLKAAPESEPCPSTFNTWNSNSVLDTSAQHILALTTCDFRLAQKVAKQSSRPRTSAYNFQSLL